MRSLRHFIFPIYMFATFVDLQAAAAQEQPGSLWDLNNSVLGLYANGTERIFRYEEPRPAAQEQGVEPKTILFKGTRSGNTYKGTAYVFYHHCNPFPFDVEGTVADDERRITFTGDQPTAFDAQCKPIDFEEVEFDITFLRSVAPPIVVGSIDRDPAAAKEVQEQEAHLAAILADKEREERRLRDLRAENDRHERDLRNRQRERDQAEQQLAALRAYAGHRDACRKYDIAECETALRSAHASTQDAIDLRDWRGVALKFSADLDACRNGSLSACDAAIASPALADAQRPQLEQWRAAASPYNRAVVWFSGYAGIFAATTSDVIATIRNLPTSTHVTGGIAAVLALALAGLAIRNRRAHSTDNSMAAEPSPVRSDAAPKQPLADPAPAPRPEPVRVPPETVRDTPGAIAALELARAYIEEVRQADMPGLEDNDVRKQHLNSLALASKQLDAAHRLDPDALLEGEDEKEIPYRYSINALKAEALLLEGITHQTYDVKRAIPALRKATILNPNSAHAFYVLGLTHAANMNRGEAVAAFERAVALDPKNLVYRKELNRAQSLSTGEIAAYKATRAGEKIFDAGVKTANVGIFIYNIGIYTWNVFAFAWNVLTFPFRLVLKIFGVFDRILGIR